MRRPLGFTLTELLLSLTLLAMGIAIAFGIFDFGIHGFRIGLMRQTLQAEGRRTMALLERDVRQSALDGTSTNLVNQRSPREPRHALCLPGMDKWTEPSNFNGWGDPQYNRYMLYYATLEDPGRLYRVELDPTGPASGDDPWKDFPTDFGIPPWSIGPPSLIDIPNVVGPLELRRLADHVSGFKVIIPGNTCIVCQLTLRAKTRLAGQKDRDEIIQLNLYTPVYSTQTNPNET